MMASEIGLKQLLNVSDPGTASVDAHLCRHRIRGKRVWLMDTPGFDGSGSEVLLQVEEYLASRCDAGTRASGVLYTHDISASRATYTNALNVPMLQELCGPDYMNKMILVTTKWDIVDPKLGMSREGELVNGAQPWGSNTAQHWGTQQSALKIIDKLIDGLPKPFDAEHVLAMLEETQRQGQMLRSDVSAQTRGLGKEIAEAEAAMQRLVQEMTGTMRKQNEAWQQQLERVQGATSQVLSFCWAMVGAIVCLLAMVLVRGNLNITSSSTGNTQTNHFTSAPLASSWSGMGAWFVSTVTSMGVGMLMNSVLGPIGAAFGTGVFGGAIRRFLLPASGDGAAASAASTASTAASADNAAAASIFGEGSQILRYFTKVAVDYVVADNV